MITTRKRITTAAITLLLILLAGRAIWLLLPSSVKIYDIGHVFDEYENDTDYINPDAPFINVGGRVYFIAKEEWYAGALTDYCRIISYIDYKTGRAYSVCENKNCIHNKIEYTKNCTMAYFHTDLIIDDQGWIYGVYQPGVIATSRPYVPDTTQNRGEPQLGRFNLYNQIYETLYEYEYDVTQAGYLVPYSIDNIATTYQYVYFTELLFPGRNGGKSKSYFRRYDITTNTTQTLAETSMTAAYHVFRDSLYVEESDGLYRYDLDYTPQSRVKVLDYSSAFFKDCLGVRNFQYDADAQMIYFIRVNQGRIGYGGYSGTLCRVRAYNEDDDAGVVNRKPYEILTDGEVCNYQLTEDCIYYDLYEQRYMGDVVGHGNISVPHYDNTDGHVYSLSYAECYLGERIARHTVWYNPAIYMKNWTIIGNYLYGELYEKVKTANAGDYHLTGYCPTQQIRIDLTTGHKDALHLDNWDTPT